MNDFPQYLCLIGGLVLAYVGLRNKLILDLIIGLCFIAMAVLKLSHRTGELIDAIDAAIGVAVVAAAILKLRTKRHG